LTPSISRIFPLVFAASCLYAQITIDTFAGGHVQSGVSAQNASLPSVSGITRDPKGNLVIADSSLNVIRRVNSDGTIETIAGTGVPGFGGDGGPATRAILNYPTSPHYDAAGNLYFWEAKNFRIRRIDTSGTITTIAGTGIQGTLGAGGPATLAQIDFISDLAVDHDGNVYLGEPIEKNLRRVTPAGEIEIYASCPSCMPSLATHLAIDITGNLYLSDGSHIYKVTPDKVVHNFAFFGASSQTSGNGGPAIDAPPSNIFGLTADDAGNVYTEETPVGNNPTAQFVIRRIGTDGIVNAVGGTLDINGIQTDGPALQTALFTNAGFGITPGPNGTLIFADVFRIRQLTTQSTIQSIVGGHVNSVPEGTRALDAWFLQPTAIAFNNEGELYVGQSCIVQKIDSTGIIRNVTGILCPTLNPIVSIAVDSRDQLYLADFMGSMYKLDANGVPNKITSFPLGPFPRIAVDSHDRLYYVAFIGEFGRIAPESQPQTIDTRFNGSGLAIDSADNVYVCCERFGGLIDKYSPDLTPTQLGPGQFAFQGENELAVDAASNIWLGSRFFGLIKNSTPIGNGCCFYGDGGPAESAYISPSDMAFAPNGDLYFLDTVVGRVRRIHGSPPTVKPSISAAGIVNAASLEGGKIAPGELISIFGSNLGPPGLDLAAVQNNVIPAALNNVHVYFGATPGRIVARTNLQINVFVPYSVANATSVPIVVDVDTVRSDAITVPVAASIFGISTHDGSGQGQGAIFNQDGTLNSHAVPAARGSIVTLFGTGEGVTSPALPDGALVISTPYSTTQSAVIVKFAGQTADVKYSGAAPFLPTGVFQINAVIPAGVTPGDVPVTVSIGGVETTRNVTVAVQ
jgi:uncharacterized protein (TIGR03437 family)